MSTYIEILRAHQRGKLKTSEPSQQDPATALPESTADASPDELLQEEALESLPEPSISEDALTEVRSSPALDEGDDALDEDMPQEEMSAASPTTDADNVAPGALPEEPGKPLPDSGTADDEAPGDMLQEESATSPIPDVDTVATGALPEEPGRPSSDSGTADDEAPGDMLQEESAASPTPDTDTVAAGGLPEEPGKTLWDLGESEDFALEHLLQEEVRHPPPDFDAMDDATFAQMLQDEPEAPSAGRPHPEQDESSTVLADETLPETPAEHPTDGVAAEDGVHTWLSGCVMLMVRIYEDAARNEATDISPMLRHLERFSAKIYDEPEEVNALELDIANRIESIRQTHASCGDLVQKAIMMMLYAYKVCAQMRMDPAEMTHYVAAAILHNIGMAQIFVDTRQKEGTLTNAERTLIRRVPDTSREYLKRCGITDRVILLAAEQSHERYDGSGPRGLAGADIALSARIVGLLSMFEALVHVRTYRARLLPLDAIRELVNGQKNRFDPSMLKALIESVSLYPVGTYVQLNSGDIGQVIRVQPRLPLRPQIVLIMDRHGNHIQPREVDLHKQPNLMIQRCMYREGLAPVKREEEEKQEEQA